MLFRSERVAFTIPYAEASQAMLIRAGDAGAIKGVTDLNGRSIAVKLGSPGQILQERIAALTAACRIEKSDGCYRLISA